jgi:hypothetical protein
MQCVACYPGSVTLYIASCIVNNAQYKTGKQVESGCSYCRKLLGLIGRNLL